VMFMMRGLKILILQDLRLNRKGAASDVLKLQVVFLILFVVFFGLMIYYVGAYQDGVILWEDFYAKEVSRLINNAEPGTEFSLDITNIAAIGAKNGRDTISDIFAFDNKNKLVIVSLEAGKGSRFPFYNDVDVRIIRGEPGLDGVVRFNFEVVRASNA